MALTASDLLDNNRRFVAARIASDPHFFTRRAGEHKPQFLWIGCSDARVPADLITGTEPGQIFVHRNVANQVVPTDANLLAALQYAVDVLKVTDVIVCGHGACGGVKAVLEGGAPPAVAQWLSNLRTVARLHDDELQAIGSADDRLQRLVELNVAEQLLNLSRTATVQEAWARGQTLRLHGWVYGLAEGLLHDVGPTLDGSPATPETVPSSRSARVPVLRVTADRRQATVAT
jgi:carbonic anhydrase